MNLPKKIVLNFSTFRLLISQHLVVVKSTKWCQKFLEIGGNLANDVYMKEPTLNLHLTCQFWRAHSRQTCQQICPTQRGRTLSLVVVGGLWRSHCTQCHTWCLQYKQVFLNSLKPRPFLALLDKGSSSRTMSWFTNLAKYNNLWKMLDTSIFVCPSYNLFLNVA